MTEPSGITRFLSLLRRQAGLFVLAAVAAWLCNYFFLSRAYVELDCLVGQPTELQISWAGSGERYFRANEAQGHLEQGVTQVGFYLGDLRSMRTLRLSLSGKPGGTAVFRSITVTQPGFKPLLFSAKTDFDRFRPGKDVSPPSFAEGQGWAVASAGGNASFHLELEPHGTRSLFLPAETVCFLIIILLLHLLLRAFSRLADDFSHVAVLLVGVTLLAAVMAVSTRPGVHPDEGAHGAAAAYYERHWLPPAADSPEVAATCSEYGVSRLNSSEIAYFLIGKFVRLAKSLPRLPSHQLRRLFNVLLLAVLTALACRSAAARLVFLPLLMTPQVWYVFSCCNSDAFALFAVLLAAVQLADQNSRLHRLLDGHGADIGGILLLGLLTGALLLIKKNFYFFLFFAGCSILATFSVQRHFSWLALKKLLATGAVGLALFGIRWGLDMHVNGFDKAEKVEKLKEQQAAYLYKPSTDLRRKHPYLSLRTRGTSLKSLFTKHRWGGKVLRSFYGVYGHMTVSGSTRYYNFMRTSGFLFLIFILLTVLFRGGWEERTLLLSVAGCSLALIAAACWESWTKDFQPQGRYLLVILPMLGVLLARAERLIPPLILHTFFAVMFLLSLHNFIFIGIASPIL
jgi:hypothetical protein